MTARAIPADPAAAFAPAAAEPGAILLETQRPRPGERYSYLLRRPVDVLVARTPDEVIPALEEAGRRQTDGYAVAGFVAYEAGFAIDAAFAGEPIADPGIPLVWLGVYPGLLRFDHLCGRWSSLGAEPPEWPVAEAVPGPTPDSSGVFPGALPPFSIPDGEYFAKVEQVRDAIARGEVYQANLTGAFRFSLPADPFALYLRLRAAHPVPFGAFIRTEALCVVSQSPELFFRIRGGVIETRPMKGTAARGLTDAEDRRIARGLRADPKNRAENVMIVDLLRNDLGRVCEIGSVRVPRLFEVQRFRTVHQMVSTVTGRVRPGTTPADLFRALFPCGSVTGAPKLAAMRLLRRLEPAPRGVYTGAIGILLPGGDMAFSVAIRTATVRDGRAEAGAGGGIVWDSRPEDELAEVRRKGLYLTEPPADFELLETFLFIPGEGFRRLPDHLSRMGASARYFGFRFRRERILSALDAALRRQGAPAALRVRLLLARDGRVSVETRPAVPSASRPAPWRVTMSRVTVCSRDPFVRHKTTNRAWRDAELAKAREAGFDEVLFANERGELTEGAITNVFLEIGGRLVTPPLSCGVLDGVCRRSVLATEGNRPEERVLRPDDLLAADRIVLTNSVRGAIQAVLAGRTAPERPRRREPRPSVRRPCAP